MQRVVNMLETELHTRKKVRRETRLVLECHPTSVNGDTSRENMIEKVISWGAEWVYIRPIYRLQNVSNLPRTAVDDVTTTRRTVTVMVNGVQDVFAFARWRHR